MGSRYAFESKFRHHILKCSKCGFCQAVCPVYGVTIRSTLNARGKMLLLKEVIDGVIELNNELIEPIFQCTMCGACTDNCPSGINVPDIIRQVRKDLLHADSCHPVIPGAHKMLNRHTNIYGEENFPDFGRVWAKKADYVFFIGCVGAYREKKATAAILKLLDNLEINYSVINEICCSGILEDIGDKIRDSNISIIAERILATGCGTVITSCPYCLRTFNGTAYKTLHEHNIKFIHISQFISSADFNISTDKKITYHDPCDLGRHCGIYDEPRKIIAKIATNFIEMRHNKKKSLCCGAGGGVRGSFAASSVSMAKRRLNEAEEIGAEIILTECNSCIHNFNNGKFRNQKFKICTTYELINELIEANRESASEDLKLAN